MVGRPGGDEEAAQAVAERADGTGAAEGEEEGGREARRAREARQAAGDADLCVSLLLSDEACKAVQ
jgi:hypothetical protein